MEMKTRQQDALIVTWQAAVSDDYNVEIELDGCNGYKRGKLLLKQR